MVISAKQATENTQLVRNRLKDKAQERIFRVIEILSSQGYYEVDPSKCNLFDDDIQKFWLHPSYKKERELVKDVFKAAGFRIKISPGSPSETISWEPPDY